MSTPQAEADDRYKVLKNVNILEFRNCIRNHHDKCNQISTNIPSIGLIISERAFEILAF